MKTVPYSEERCAITGGKPASVALYKSCRLPSAPVFPIFFPIFSGLPIFSYILIQNPIFFHQIPIFFKMLQIIMKYQGIMMEFWFEMPVLMSLVFIFFSLFASLARNLINKVVFLHQNTR